MRKIRFVLLASFSLSLLLPQFGCQKAPKVSGPEGLVRQMVEAVGGRDELYALKDVEYEYTYLDPATGQKDVSIERYIFDGEFSWAEYTVREKNVFPNLEGKLIQGYNGSETWATLNGDLVTDPMVMRISDFLRKTNFYWFTMMYKLLDPGMNYESKGTKNIDGVEYDLVGITYDENVGDAQDTYVLYINPETHLVDRFLFTVMDFKTTDPYLMKVQYEEISGLKLPARRLYTKSDWEGVPKDDAWKEEISANIKFDNGFTAEMFEKPAAPNMSSKH